MARQENQGGQRRSSRGGRGRRSSRRRRGGRRRFRGRRKKCIFCEEKISYIDYKQTDLLRQFLTDRGKIRPQRQTGTCAKHQRQLSVAIKRARHLAMLPFTVGAQHSR